MPGVYLRAFAHKNQHRVFPCIIAALGCTVSLILTVRLCTELRGDDHRLIPAAMGVAWEVAKYHFVVAGLALLAQELRSKRIHGTVLLSIAAILTLGSIAASLAYLVEADQATRLQQAQQSSAYQRLSQQIAGLDAELATLTASAAADQSNHYRTRALQTLSKLPGLRKERQEATNKLEKVLQSGGDLQRNDAFDHFARAFGGGTAGTWRLWAYAIVAIMLECISIAALALCRRGEPAAESLELPSPKQRPGRLIPLRPQQAKRSEAVRERTAKVYRLAQVRRSNTGALGKKPGVRAASGRKTTRASQPPATAQGLLPLLAQAA